MGRFIGIAINGADLSERGVDMLRDYSIGGTAITNTIFQGRNRSSYRLLAYTDRKRSALHWSMRGEPTGKRR